MKTIILPGLSIKNKDWAEEVEEKLGLDHEVVVHNWKHWPPARTSGSENLKVRRRTSGSERQAGSFSVKHEKDAILSKIADDKVNIIAKSIGTRMVMHLIPLIKEQLVKTVLCGIPTKLESETPRRLYKEGLLLLSPSRVVVFQNENDPLANFSIIAKFIHSVNPKIKVVKKFRNDHHYPYFEDFQKLLLS